MSRASFILEVVKRIGAALLRIGALLFLAFYNVAVFAALVGGVLARPSLEVLVWSGTVRQQGDGEPILQGHDVLVGLSDGALWMSHMTGVERELPRWLVLRGGRAVIITPMSGRVGDHSQKFIIMRGLREDDSERSWLARATGFWLYAGQRPIPASGPRVLHLTIPLWLLTGIALAIDAGVARPRWRQWSRRRRGECTACGYNLRGTASESCPECGHRR